MKDYLMTYQSHILYIIVVVFSVVVLNILTYFIDKWYNSKNVLHLENDKIKPLKLLKRTLNTLWFVLGVIALSFVFVDRSKDKEIIGFFKLVSYLGLVAVVTIVAVSTTNRWFNNKIHEKTANKNDPTSFKFLRYLAIFSICYTGILMALFAFPSFRTLAQTALGGAGLLVIITGVASQEALSNIVGGIFIILFKPFKIGDIIRVTDSMVGEVVDLTMRHTLLRNFENKMIIIPNSIINKEKIVNYDFGESKNCEYIEINITYDSNMKLAKKIMQEECEKHPLIYDNRTIIEINENEPIVKTALINFNDYTVTLRAWAWSANYSDSFTLKTNVFESIKVRFDQEGIQMQLPLKIISTNNTNSL